MTETVLLTGISGFIAKHVAARFLTAGYAVRGSLRSMGRADEVRTALASVVSEADLARLTFVALDLEADTGWAEAMAGVTTLVHTASPFPLENPKDEQSLIRPAVQGTLRALRAAKAAGVMRVVLTSSTVAVLNNNVQGEHTEADWADVTAASTSAYAKSKTLAERAAWDFVAGEGAGMALTTINPGLVLGPALDRHFGSSLSLVQRLLRGKDPMVPNLGFPLVDVRDVAEMHLRAVQRPETAGKRYLAGAGTLSMPQMARLLKAAYPARKIATRTAPMWLLRVIALFDAQVRMILPNVGRIERASNARARADMGMEFISPEVALKATADWLIAAGEV
ncbi:MAG: NAD-dependent epimerase/dehydratase family protein [Cypionkella sp.]